MATIECRVTLERLRDMIITCSHPRKVLIDIQNIDCNEYFKWCSVRYLHLSNLLHTCYILTTYYPGKITKADKDFARILDFKDI